MFEGPLDYLNSHTHSILAGLQPYRVPPGKKVFFSNNEG
jgi:hypothetical protein